MLNTFYAVRKPFRIYRHTGISPSNSWVGASRAFTTVMNAENCQAGDILHSLCGGLFITRGTDLSPISLVEPKPIFERSYGGTGREELLKSRAEKGFIEEIPTPSRLPDYAAANEKVSKNLLAEYHRQVVTISNSPEYDRLKQLQEIFRQALPPAAELAVKANDYNAYDTPRLGLTCNGMSIELSNNLRGLWIILKPGDYIGSLKPAPAYSGHDRETYQFADPDDPKAETMIEHLGFIAAGRTEKVS